MKKQYTIGDILEVRIEKIVPRGLGLAFVDGLTVFVPLSVTGDKLSVRIREVKKKIAFADIVEVIEGGEQRITPPCEYFGSCGGCDFQQMNYAAQLDAKVGIIRDCLHRIGKIDYDAEINVIPSPQQFGYRSRARWHIDRDKKAIGYFRRDSHEVIDVQKCPILTPELQSALDDLRMRLNWDEIWSDKAQIEAANGEDGSISTYSADMAEPTSELTFEFDGNNYVYSSETFFQANKSLIPALVEAALGDAIGEAAFDLYCGVGLFTIPMAKRFGTVVGVEESGKSVKFAKRNVYTSGQTNVRLASQSVAKFLMENQKKGLDFILIDPPRSGTEKQTIPKIARLKPAHISYVSCEPSILARDLSILIDAGYKIEKITALDMFPQTHHVETVVRLSVART
ncbi:MAG: class I SAM-dependent RNA methyltransferase [Chloracidobacterium sp.]|nr:class I SAM-dependent RNA methyltransferase [Chloracidobacterium sp.]